MNAKANMRSLGCLLLALLLALPLTPPARAATRYVDLTASDSGEYYFIHDLENRLGDDFEYVRYLRLIDSSMGSLRYDYRGSDSRTVSYNTTYHRNERLYMDRVCFVPDGDRGTARVTMEVRTTYGRSYDMELSIYVSDSYRRSGGSSLSYTTSTEPLFLSGDDIASALGISLDYITDVRLNNTSAGTLYYDYRSGGSNETVSRYNDYYHTSSSGERIDRICFVPRENHSGTAEITFTAYETNSSRSYSGTISIQTGSVTYETDGKPIHFSGADLERQTGLALSYAAFSLRRAAAGSLYYNYTDAQINEGTLASGTRCYLSGEPAIDKVYFVPAAGFTGTAEVAFTAYDASGKTRSGTILVKVTDTDSDTASGDAGAIVYHLSGSRSVWLNITDFDNRSRSATGAALSSLSFTSLPAASQGTIYNGSGSSEPVALNRSYSAVNNLRFAAGSGFTGSVSARYTGRATNGREYEGVVRFDVNSGSGGALDYTVEPGRRVYFRAQDFSDACYSATGYDIDHIIFDTLPSSSQGRLYSGSSYTVSRTSGNYYSRSKLSDLNFYADNDFTGSVAIGFTGYATGYTSSSGSRRFSGTITVRSTDTAAAPAATTAAGNTVSYTSTGLATQLSAASLQTAVTRVLSGAAQTVRLGAPAAGSGKLCLDFVSLSRFTPFEDQKAYSLTDIDRVYFLPKSGFKGTATVPYTAADATGNTCAGEIRITVTPPTASAYFYDMGDCVWAVPAVDFFYSYGAVNGNARSAFGPNAEMKRGDFVLLLSRAFHFPAPEGGSGFADVSSDSYYGAAIASARELGIVAGSTARRFEPERVILREEAATLIYRCLRRTTAITPGTFEDLTGFPDCSNTSAGAVPAMGALVRIGVFNGDAGRLRPRMPLSRAETITILYRALT